jgi:hypothetical protein
MEARLLRALVAAALAVSMGASYPTPNFIVQTADPQLAEQIGKAGEKYRRELAIAWLGRTMPDWAQPCVMTVHVGPRLGAGGATTFLFDRGEVYGWRMNIQGSAERVLDSVVPHEITHMVFASHFRCPLPRWADEGGATSVEHSSELAKHHKMLVQFLRSSRGIAFNQMYAMTEYPQDVMPLYAQAFSLAEYLIMQGGKQKFVGYLAEGMKTDRWSAATQQHYGYRDLGALQNAWLAWVAQGFPAIQPRGGQPEGKPAIQLASTGGKRPRPEPNLIYRIHGKEQNLVSTGSLVPVMRPGRAAESGSVSAAEAGVASAVASASGQSASPVLPASGWHAPGAPAPQPTAPPPAVAEVPPPQAAEPIRTQVTHPQPIEQPRQIILR